MQRKLTRRTSHSRTPAFAGIGIWTLGAGVTAKGFSPNDKLNLASIGIGGRGSANTYGMGKLENMAALCDVDDVRAGEGVRRLPEGEEVCRLPRVARQDGQGNRRGHYQHAGPHAHPSGGQGNDAE